MKLFEKFKVKKEREFRILGFPVVQYGRKKEGDFEEKYLEIFPKSLEAKTLDKILSFIPKDQNHDHIWIVRTAGLGEAQLLNFMINELKQKWNVKNPCFISHRKIYKEMFEMYSDIPFYNLDIPHNEYAPYLKNRNIKYKNKYFHIHHCTIDESLNWLKRHQDGDTSHAIESYKEFAEIKEFETCTPKFSEELKQTTLSKIKDLNIDKFVFLAPEANGTESLKNEFWIDLTKILEQKGYDVFVNTETGNTLFGKSVYLTIAEATYLASRAKAIIGLRCGFLEVLAAIRERNTLYTLYTPFRSITSKNFFETYTLKNYPFANKNIVEFVINQNNTNEILAKIEEEL